MTEEPTEDTFELLMKDVEADMDSDLKRELADKEKGVEYWRELREEIIPALDGFSSSEDPLPLRLRKLGITKLRFIQTIGQKRVTFIQEPGEFMASLAGPNEREVKRGLLTVAIAQACFVRVDFDGDRVANVQPAPSTSLEAVPVDLEALSELIGVSAAYEHENEETISRHDVEASGIERFAPHIGDDPDYLEAFDEAEMDEWLRPGQEVRILPPDGTIEPVRRGA